MSRDNPYQVPQIHSTTVTFSDNGGFALGATGIKFDQNGGITSLLVQVYPDSGRTSTAGAFAVNGGFQGQAVFYYNGPQVASSATVLIGGESMSYAYWADQGIVMCYCNTGGGAVPSFKADINAEWNHGARIVPRDFWSDSNGRHPQVLFTRLDSFLDADDLFADFRGYVAVETAGLPNPSSKYQPGRLWGWPTTKSDGVGGFANGAAYASGTTGLTFPQEGGVQWLFACLRPDAADGQGAAEQIGNVKIEGKLKFFYDGPQLASTATFSIASETWNYAYEKDMVCTMYCVTNAGNWEIKEATDINKTFRNPFRIVDRDVHSGGAQRVHVRMDFEDPWDSVFDKAVCSISVATVRYDNYGNFKAAGA